MTLSNPVRRLPGFDLTQGEPRFELPRAGNGVSDSNGAGRLETVPAIQMAQGDSKAVED